METLEFDYKDEIKSNKDSSTEPSYTSYSLRPLENIINTILPSQSEENKIIKARSLLGDVASNLSDDQIENIVTEFDYLANCWLDRFERETFGKTIKELNK